MLFPSLTFALFLVCVFLAYWLVLGHSRRLQNSLLLIASYVFYGWWDWRFLSLIAFSSLVDFLAGRAMGTTVPSSKRRYWLVASLVVNLGFLALFKYYDFFITSLSEALASAGLEIELSTLGLILPVGISFYSFQTLSYTIDVYRNRMAPTKDMVAFFAYVSFFPQLVAGPIERAARLLPQFQTDRRLDVDTAKDGLRLMLWGLFKKVVIADSCAPLVERAFSNPGQASTSMLALAVVLFAFQIYCDFSGYSDIAKGCARLFGIELMDNFAYPYFSRNVGEFWRRWHISLSSWFRDYVYIPLGGSRMGKPRAIANIFIVFVLSGAWHGANWTFIIWGAIHGLCYLPLFLANPPRYGQVVAADRRLPSVREALSIVVTFMFVCVAWVFFRAESVEHAVSYLSTLIEFRSLSLPPQVNLLNVCASISLLVVIEWRGRHLSFPLQGLSGPIWRRWTIYLLLAGLVLLHGNNQDAFIYFQF